MERKRQLVIFRHYFRDFFEPLGEPLKRKIDEVLYMVCVAERIPAKFFSHMKGYNGLYEIRIEFRSNIYRVFCCFDEENVVVLFNGFQKKTQKTPKSVIEKALKIKAAYFEWKARQDGKTNNNIR